MSEYSITIFCISCLLLIIRWNLFWNFLFSCNVAFLYQWRHFFEISCHTHPSRAKRFTEMWLFSIFRMNTKIKRIVEQDSRERFFLEPEVICNLSVIFKRVVGGFNSQWTVISRYKQGSISLIIVWSYLLFVYKLFFFSHLTCVKSY